MRILNFLWHKLIFFIHSQRFPFDWHNPFGYLIAVILEAVAHSYTICYLGSLLSLAAGVFMFAISGCKYGVDVLKKIQKQLQRKRKPPPSLMHFNKFHSLQANGSQLSNLTFISHCSHAELTPSLDYTIHINIS